MEAQIRDTHTLRSQWRTKGMDKSIHIVLDYCKCATSEILDNTTEWWPWKVQITILTSQYSHLISSHKKSFLLMKLLRTKISLYFYSKSLLLHHQCRRLLHILGTWSKLALALNRSSRTKLQRKWGRKQLLPENNKRSVCCQVNRSPLPTTKKGGNFPSPSQPIQKLQTLPLYCQLHLKPLRSLDHLPTVSISMTNASIQHTMNNYLWYYWSASAVLYFPR